MEFDFSGFSEITKKALAILFGDQIPEYISKALAVFVIIFAVLIASYSSIWLLSHTIELFNEKLKPYFYNTQKKRRQKHR